MASVSHGARPVAAGGRMTASGDMTAAEVRTTCPYCGVGCGVLARSPRTAAFRPRRPGSPGQLRPIVFEGIGAWGNFVARRAPAPSRDRRQPATWDEALDLVADTFTDTIAGTARTRSASTFPGQLLTEDYYVANKLMKGFIGSGNIDTNSRLCMASSVAGHRRAFGADASPASMTTSNAPTWWS